VPPQESGEAGGVSGAGASTNQIAAENGTLVRRDKRVLHAATAGHVAVMVDPECGGGDEEEHHGHADEEALKGLAALYSSPVFAQAVVQANDACCFKDKEQIDKEEAKKHEKRQSNSIFLRQDVGFNPDSKERFWHNVVNVVGAYCGVGLHACVVPAEDAEFQPRVNLLAALHAARICFSIIVCSRTILRSLLTRQQFKHAQIFIFWFLGFCTCGLFPLLHDCLMNELESPPQVN